MLPQIVGAGASSEPDDAGTRERLRRRTALKQRPSRRTWSCCRARRARSPRSPSCATPARVPLVVRGGGTGYTRRRRAAARRRGAVAGADEPHPRDRRGTTCSPSSSRTSSPATSRTRWSSVGLFYPPDPASLRESVIGGNVAECAGGPRAFKYGTTRHYVLGLEAVLPTGEIIRTGSKAVKNVVGYDLTQLLVGSEGTLAIITQAVLRLVPKPPAHATLRATFDGVDAAVEAVNDAAAGARRARDDRAGGRRVPRRGRRATWASRWRRPAPARCCCIEVDGHAQAPSPTRRSWSRRPAARAGATEVLRAADRRRARASCGACGASCRPR